MAIEGTGGYGAGLTRFLAAHAEQVVELDRPKRAARRPGAKSDPLDAIRAAREALARDQLAQPRAAGQRAALSVRLAARRSAVQATTDAQRQLHALVVAAPDCLRSRLRNLTTPRLVATCGRLRLLGSWDVETAATAASLRALARRIHLLNTEVADHTRAILELVRAWRPDLLSRCGVGPIVAATVLCAWSHPGRCPSDAAFAMLGGTAPIPASSGQTIRVRLNRSGDRHRNQALHLIVLTRLRDDPATRAYAQRRRAEGKTNRRPPPARAATRGHLPESWMPPAPIADARTQVRLRRGLVGERTAWQQRIHAILFHHGLPDRSQLLTTDGRAWLARAELPAVARQTIELALRTIDHLEVELDTLNGELAGIARAQPGCQALMGRYGIGWLTAVAIWAEFGDVGRFANSRQAVRFCGLDITIAESDGNAPAATWPARAPRCCAGRCTRRP